MASRFKVLSLELTGREVDIIYTWSISSGTPSHEELMLWSKIRDAIRVLHEPRNCPLGKYIHPDNLAANRFPLCQLCLGDK